MARHLSDTPLLANSPQHTAEVQALGRTNEQEYEASLRRKPRHRHPRLFGSEHMLPIAYVAPPDRPTVRGIHAHAPGQHRFVRTSRLVEVCPCGMSRYAPTYADR